MDSGLLWSALAKRRDRIEPQRRGIPAAFAKNLGLGFHTRRGDGAFRWVYVELLQDKSAASAASAGGFLTRLIDKAPFTITTVLTDNGKEFTDRFCDTGQRQPTGAHAFDRVCTANRIEHRLTKPRTPQKLFKKCVYNIAGLDRIRVIRRFFLLCRPVTLNLMALHYIFPGNTE